MGRRDELSHSNANLRPFPPVWTGRTIERTVSTLGWILGTTLAVSLVAWVGVFALALRDERLERLLPFLVALAAGALLGGAFLHLLPEAVETTTATGGHVEPVFGLALVGFCTFFVLDQFVHWHHHHGVTHDHEPVTTLVLVADTVHNFLDGIVVAGAFLASVPVGLVTVMVVGLHEIPQEIGDFGVLVYGGIEPRRALVLNYLTQAAVIVGGLVGYVLAEALLETTVLLLAFAAGSFTYIATTDLIPELQREEDTLRSLSYFAVFLGGLLLLVLVGMVVPEH